MQKHLSITQIRQAGTKEDLIRAMVQSRVSGWWLYRNAVILEIADRTSGERGFYQAIADEASQVLGIEISAESCRKVCCTVI